MSSQRCAVRSAAADLTGLLGRCSGVQYLWAGAASCGALLARPQARGHLAEGGVLHQVLHAPVAGQQRGRHVGVQHVHVALQEGVQPRRQRLRQGARRSLARLCTHMRCLRGCPGLLPACGGMCQGPWVRAPSAAWLGVCLPAARLLRLASRGVSSCRHTGTGRCLQQFH